MTHDSGRNKCPTDDVIRGFANGEISDSWAEIIALHVSECSKCAEMVHECLARHDNWTNGGNATSSNLNTANGDPILSEIVRKAKQIGEQGSDSRKRKRPRRVPRRLGRYKIIKPIGVGAFGRVYLAEDSELKRQVAIKVPRSSRRAQDQFGQIMQEARSAAKLRHPGIVSVFDVGQTGDNRVFAVFEFVDGETLDVHIRRSNFSIERAVDITIDVAEALQFAHKHGIIHRDLKPSNVMIDRTGTPRIADFGLALHDQDVVRREFVGTPGYMSPEQLRGETRNLNGSTDLWSLGVVLYRMLTRHRPFQAASTEELYEQILHDRPKPPRDVDPRIPAELERICLRCLEKNRIVRYATARELVADLRAFREHAADIRELEEMSVSGKGLRPFVEQDSSYFLRLMPGPYDRYGIPESLNFWKQCFDIDNARGPQPIAILFGPTGSGKTSFVRAGLMPILPTQTTTIVIECSQLETEMNFSRQLREKYTELSHVGLVDNLARLRTDILPNRGERLLIVFDQFEQWLHGHLRRTPLLDALRQSDGDHVMSLLVVRSGFWDNTRNLCQELEMRLSENQNYASIEMFPQRHARSVLAAFGRGCGMLPAVPEKLNSAQQSFLDLAIEAMSQMGTVAPIRLALFAEILKFKPWLPKSIRDVRGPAGIDAEFLRYAMAELSGNTRFGDHRRAAQDILWSLLPENNETQLGEPTNGARKSVTELLRIAAYCDRTGYFDELMSILDTRLRLVTPVDPENAGTNAVHVSALPIQHDSSAIGSDPSPTDSVQNPMVPTTGENEFRLPEVSKYSAAERCYQLTSAYLVPVLREFLTREQRTTIEGRMRIRLRELGRDWSLSSDVRHIPSTLECLGMTFMTARSTWTPVEREVMRMASFGLFKKTAAIVATLLLVLLPILIMSGRVQRWTLVQKLIVAEMKQVPQIVEQIQRLGPHMTAPLDAEWSRLLQNQSSESMDPATSMTEVQDGLLRLACASVDYAPQRASHIVDGILSHPPDEIPILAVSLKPNPADSVSRLWSELRTAIANESRESDESTLRLASALATADPSSDQWSHVSPAISQAIVKARSSTLQSWVNNLMPVRSQLLPRLLQNFRDEDLVRESQQQNLVEAFADFAADNPEALVTALQYSTAGQFSIVADALGRYPEQAIVLAKSQFDELVHASREKLPVVRPDIGGTLQGWLANCQGQYSEKGAIALKIPIEELENGLTQMFAAGYRPNSIRPYQIGDQRMVTVCWNHSRRSWLWKHNVTPIELTELHESYKSQSLELWDFADYEVDGERRFMALWLKSHEGSIPDTRLHLDKIGKADLETIYGNRTDGYSLHRYSVQVNDQGAARYSTLWKPASNSSDEDRVYSEYFGHNELPPTAKALMDCRIVLSDPIKADLWGRHETASLGIRLQPNMEDLAKLCAVAAAKEQIGDASSALRDLNNAIEQFPDDIKLKFARGKVFGTLGDADGLRRTAEVMTLAGRKPYHAEFFLLRAAIIEGRIDDAQRHLDELERWSADVNNDNVLKYELSLSHALLAAAYQSDDIERSNTHRDRAMEVMLQSGTEFDSVYTLAISREFEIVRTSERFHELLARNGLDGRILTTQVSTPSVTSHWMPFMALAQHDAKSQQLIDEGWTPHCSTAGFSPQRNQLLVGSIWHRRDDSEDANLGTTRRLANLALLLARMRDKPLIAKVLDGKYGRELGYHLVARMSQSQVAAELLTELLDESLDRSAKLSKLPQNLLLALSTYSPDQIPEPRYPRIRQQLIEMRATETNAGLRSAAIACLNQWDPEPDGQQSDPPDNVTIDRGDATMSRSDGGWYTNSIGQTMIIVSPPTKFTIGTADTDPERFANEYLQRRYFDGSYAMSATEVTVRQFRQFLDDPRVKKFYASRAQRTRDPDDAADFPQCDIFVQDAALFCQWLSEREHIPSEQWCYPKIWSANDYRVPFDRTDRAGYRLPTEAEWEYACRGGVEDHNSRHYGNDPRILSRFAWFDENSESRNRPVATRLPNELGFFDMLGNAAEMCYEPYLERLFPSSRERFAQELHDACYDATQRTVRGGASNMNQRAARSGFRTSISWARSTSHLGFRIARTISNSH